MSTEDTQAPTEEQVKLANEATDAAWSDDFTTEQLTVKNKPEEKTEEQEEEQQVPAAEEESEEVVYTEPTPVVTVDDPGEYTPADYSFEIEVGGKTHKVDSAEKAAKLAEKYAEDLDAKQLIGLVSKAAQIAVKEERDKDAWQSKKDAYESQSAEQESRQESVNLMASEMEYLVSKGLMPEVDAQYKDANWGDPTVASQPGVKEQIDLINYMVTENEQRIKAGISPITSLVDAYNALQQDQGRKNAAAQKQADAEARKAAGARVAGVAPSNQQPYVPKGISVGNPNAFKNNGDIWAD